MNVIADMSLTKGLDWSKNMPTNRRKRRKLRISDLPLQSRRPFGVRRKKYLSDIRRGKATWNKGLKTKIRKHLKKTCGFKPDNSPFAAPLPVTYSGLNTCK